MEQEDVSEQTWKVGEKVAVMHRGNAVGCDFIAKVLPSGRLRLKRRKEAMVRPSGEIVSSDPWADLRISKWTEERAETLERAALIDALRRAAWATLGTDELRAAAQAIKPKEKAT